MNDEITWLIAKVKTLEAKVTELESERVPPSSQRVVAPPLEGDAPRHAEAPRCAGRSRRVLTLPLKRRWFEAIKDGTKTEEYRLCTDYWRKRLYKKYDEIVFTLGYPKRDDASRRMRFKYAGVYRRELTHEEWGNEPQQVYAIRIGDAVANEVSGRRNGGGAAAL